MPSKGQGRQSTRAFTSPTERSAWPSWGSGTRKRPTMIFPRWPPLIRQGMDEGAIGLSTGIVYAPAAFSDRRELVALCRAAAEKDGVFTIHMRSEAAGVVENVEETIAIGQEAGVRVHISHHKVSGMTNWGNPRKP